MYTHAAAHHNKLDIKCSISKKIKNKKVAALTSKIILISFVRFVQVSNNV